MTLLPGEKFRRKNKRKTLCLMTFHLERPLKEITQTVSVRF